MVVKCPAVNDFWSRASDEGRDDRGEESAPGARQEDDERQADDPSAPDTSAGASDYEDPQADDDERVTPPEGQTPLAVVATAGDEDEGDLDEVEGLSAHESATRIQEIIDEAQQSAKHFIEEARRQSELLIDEAHQEAREERAQVVDEARTQVDSLTNTAESMLDGARELTSELSDAAVRLRDSSERLQQHVDELLRSTPAPEAPQEESGVRRRLGRR